MSTPPPDHWHILGAGAIGCLFADSLVRAGVRTTLLLRDNAALALLRRDGLRCERDGITSRRQVDASVGAGGAPIRQLLICTKAHQTGDALAAVAPALATDATLVLLQNGMGVDEQLRSRWPAAHLLQGLSTEGVWRRGPFHIVHAARGETVIGAVTHAHRETAQRLTAAWRSLDLSLRPVTDIRRRQWIKLAVNCVINPLTAMHRCRNGELLHLPDIEETVAALCTELALVAAQEGEPLCARELAQQTFAVMQNTAANRSSMLQDVERGATTEADFLNGFVVRQGQRHGIDCPAHRTLWQQVAARD